MTSHSVGPGNDLQIPFIGTSLRETSVMAEAALRTAAHAVGYRLMGLGKRPQNRAQRHTAQRQLREAYELQKNMLSRPDVARALRAVEKQDLLQLPVFLACLPFDIHRWRQRREGVSTYAKAVTPRDGFSYPDYYLHDYHYQANGTLSWRAAVTYEWQIRFLFAGASRLMRQAVIDAVPKGGHLQLLDVGCGTAAWMQQARMQNVGHECTGVDLSPDYISFARRQAINGATFLQTNAEELPAEWNERFDIVTCIWMYHELPQAAQQRVTASIARVLKPGGTLLFMDAAQQSDVPEDDIGHVNTTFAETFNEPWFMDYQKLDLARLLLDHGLVTQTTRRFFVSKLMVCQKQPADS